MGHFRPWSADEPKWSRRTQPPADRPSAPGLRNQVRPRCPGSRGVASGGEGAKDCRFSHRAALLPASSVEVTPPGDSKVF